MNDKRSKVIIWWDHRISLDCSTYIIFAYSKARPRMCLVPFQSTNVSFTSVLNRTEALTKYTPSSKITKHFFNIFLNCQDKDLYFLTSMQDAV